MRTKSAPIPDAITAADWHLREDTPVCRTDNFYAAQWRKVDFIADLQRQYGCPVIHAGDLYNHWKPSPELITTTMEHLPSAFLTVYGQHDLPQHNLKLIRKSGIFTLLTSGHLSISPGSSFGEEPKKDCNFLCIKGRKILVMHRLVWQGECPWPGCTDPNVDEVLDEYVEYDLIITGDNHKPFVAEGESGNKLVNTGSLTRQTADQIDHRPRVYLWYADTNALKPIYLPIEQGVISREHIDYYAERDERIEAFISRLHNEYVIDISFEENLERFLRENKIRQSVSDLVWKAVEAEKC
jgi:DNA repair exonuclease SbcCD nuclease subunit